MYRVPQNRVLRRAASYRDLLPRHATYLVRSESMFTRVVHRSATRRLMLQRAVLCRCVTFRVIPQRAGFRLLFFMIFATPHRAASRRATCRFVRYRIATFGFTGGEKDFLSA